MPKSPKRSSKKIVLIGATLTGNRGAESMLQAAVQRIPQFAPDVRFTLLSLYPKEDKIENYNPDLKITDCPPWHLMLIAFPLSLLAGLLRVLRAPWHFLLVCSAAAREIASADLVIDLSGISFSDGRGAGILAYNVAVVSMPKLLGTKILKYSQAVGPFQQFLNRELARRVLPMVDAIAARGRITKEHLKQVSVAEERIRICADAAFAMDVEAAAEHNGARFLEHRIFERPVVGVSASSEVDRLCREKGIDYASIMVAFACELIERKGYGILLLAHAIRPGTSSEKNNDAPVCERIIRQIKDSEYCLYPDEALDAQSLRLLIGKCRLLVASRFHAMISGLAMKTPTMLVGWSHKYNEVLEAFGLESFALDYASISLESLQGLFDRLEREEADYRQRIDEHLAAVIDSSLDNARLAAKLLQ